MTNGPQAAYHLVRPTDVTGGAHEHLLPGGQASAYVIGVARPFLPLHSDVAGLVEGRERGSVQVLLAGVGVVGGRGGMPDRQRAIVLNSLMSGIDREHDRDRSHRPTETRMQRFSRQATVVT